MYRDHVRLKHANRKRLAEEMQAKQASEQLLLKDKPEGRCKVEKHPLSEMLAKYLLKAGNSGKGNSVIIHHSFDLKSDKFIISKSVTSIFYSDTSDMILYDIDI